MQESMREINSLLTQNSLVVTEVCAGKVQGNYLKASHHRVAEVQGVSFERDVTTGG